MTCLRNPLKIRDYSDNIKIDFGSPGYLKIQPEYLLKHYRISLTECLCKDFSQEFRTHIVATPLTLYLYFEYRSMYRKLCMYV